MYNDSDWHRRPTGSPEQEGVRDADFVLYVSALTTDRCGHENIIAYAAYCQLEAEMDRQVFSLLQTLFLIKLSSFLIVQMWNLIVCLCYITKEMPSWTSTAFM